MAPITIIPWKEFLSFSRKDEKGQTEFTACRDALIPGIDPQLSNWPAENFVTSVEELNRVKRQFTTRPLVLLVECGKHVPIGQRLNNRWLTSRSTPWNETTFSPGSLTAEGIRPQRFLQVKFAVLIDTSHSTIKRQLDDGFRRAETFLLSAKSFCLQFDFNAVILSWWMEQGPQDWLDTNCLDTAYCIGGRISLTNTGVPYRGLEFGIWWTICLPCYVMLAVPYKVWRNIVCQIWDCFVNITADVKAVSSVTDIRKEIVRDN